MPAHGISSALFCASPAPPPPPSVVFVHIYPISRPRRLPASNYPTLTPLFRPCYPGGLDSTRVYKCKYKYPTRTPNSRCRGTREQSALVRLIRFRANLYSQLPNIAFVSLNSTHYSLCVCPIQTPPPTPYSSFCTKNDTMDRGNRGVHVHRVAYPRRCQLSYFCELSSPATGRRPLTNDMHSVMTNRWSVAST